MQNLLNKSDVYYKNYLYNVQFISIYNIFIIKRKFIILKCKNIY